MFINIVATCLIFITCVTFWSTMLLLLMLTGVLADAGYQYGVPSVPYHLSGEQTANFQTGQSSYTDFNERGSQTFISNPDYNAYIGIAAAFKDNFHRDLSQTLSPLGFTSNTGYAQTFIPSAIGVNVNSNYQANTGSLSGKDNFNGHASTTSNLNLNNGLAQMSEYSANAYNAFPQTLLPPFETNLNSIYAQSTDLNLNNLNINTNIASEAANLNNGFIQTSLPTVGEVASNNNVAIAAPVPTVIKHIYFHVPPPDIEEQAVTPIPPLQKKTYKILFIKAPSQELTNTARLHQLVQSRNAGVDEKTLIYVLVKKPELRQTDEVPNHTKSHHEVFFVKYNSKPVDVASQINRDLEQTGSVGNVVPILHPGLVNGYK